MCEMGLFLRMTMNERHPHLTVPCITGGKSSRSRIVLWLLEEDLPVERKKALPHADLAIRSKQKKIQARTIRACIPLNPSIR